MAYILSEGSGTFTHRTNGRRLPLVVRSASVTAVTMRYKRKDTHLLMAPTKGDMFRFMHPTKNELVLVVAKTLRIARRYYKAHFGVYPR